MRYLLGLLLIIGGIAPRAWGWNEAGHMLIASLTYDRLTPETRKQLVGLLREHPRFEQDFKLPAEVPAEEADRWVFMRAAYWPDVARSFTGADASKYHRSTWHYVNVRIFLDPGHAETLGPPDDPSDDPAAAEDERRMNVLQAIAKNLEMLRRGETPAGEKAVAICWVLHLISDLHQPCHAGTLYSSRFPKGDAGGNGILITEPEADVSSSSNRSPRSRERGASDRQRPVVTARLHGYWDNILGENPAVSVLSLVAHELRNDPALRVEQLPQLKTTTTAKGWMWESHVFARDAVYDRSVRSAIRLQEIAPDEPFVPIRLDANYRDVAKLVARQRAVLAAERLATKLNKVGR